MLVFSPLTPHPRFLRAPRTAFSPEHNLKSAGRFRRHCVRFLWRHKTLIDIKPRGYFNFLRLHPPPALRPNTFPSTRFIRLTRYVYTPRRTPRSPASPSRTLPLAPNDTRLFAAPSYLAHTIHSPGSCRVYRPTFFSDSLRSHSSPRRSSEIVSAVFYNVISSDAFWRSYQSDSDCGCGALQCSFNLKLPSPPLLPASLLYTSPKNQYSRNGGLISSIYYTSLRQRTSAAVQ